MRRLFFGCCILGLVLIGVCYADILQQGSKPVAVKYKNGNVEHYVVKWTGTRTIDHHEDGHPSEPLNGWLTDTRQCHWSISSQIIRKVYLLNQNGQEYAQEELTTPLVENFANKGSDFVLTQLRSENCGDANARYQSDVNDSTKHMSDAFPGVVDSDYKKVIETMKGWPNVQSILPK